MRIANCIFHILLKNNNFQTTDVSRANIKEVSLDKFIYQTEMTKGLLALLFDSAVFICVWFNHSEFYCHWIIFIFHWLLMPSQYSVLVVAYTGVVIVESTHSQDMVIETAEVMSHDSWQRLLLQWWWRDNNDFNNCFIWLNYPRNGGNYLIDHKPIHDHNKHNNDRKYDYYNCNNNGGGIRHSTYTWPYYKK